MSQDSKLIYQSNAYQVWSDRVTEGPYSARAVSHTSIDSNYVDSNSAGMDSVPGISRHWELREDIVRYPQVNSAYPLLDALYNLSLEELKLDTRSDGAFIAGAKWQGVWTRDSSYSILLSLALVDPEASKQSLLRKVKSDRIVQDTGTGGSWPVSTDRVCWALAAWEVYLATGDRGWLHRSFEVVRNSISDDEKVVIDPLTGLARGESSFMDWREQTYPRWMQPTDIYESKSLGTNAVYYRTYRILGKMSHELGQPAADWEAKADRLRAAINSHLWINGRKFYGEYLYGRVWQTLSPRSEALGQAFSILFDIAEPARQDAILQSQPLMPYGVPTVYPQTPNIPPYHNSSVWPFVQAFWNLAAAKRGNESALVYGLASIARSSALFLTNKENFVADTGSPGGTAINSDRQLWSVAGNLAMTYRVLFGLETTTTGLELHPMVPEALGGVMTLTNFRYRGAVLSIRVSGFGDQPRRVTLDGKPFQGTIPTTLVGSHSVDIEMNGTHRPVQPLHMVLNLVAPETPQVVLNGLTMVWKSIPSAAQYQVYRNGEPYRLISESSLAIAEDTAYTQYQVASVDAQSVASFLSEPLVASTATMVFATSSEEKNGALDYVELDESGKTSLSIREKIPVAGTYIITFRYANGSGPVNTDNKCAIRTLFIDQKEAGTIVFPQRGTDQWQDWGVSSQQRSRLSAGTHNFELRFQPQDTNMNGEVNRVRVASLRMQLVTH